MKHQFHKGFSLIELVVSITIIGFLASTIIPNYRKYVDKSQRNSVKPALSYIYSLFKLNYIDKRHFGGLTLPDVEVPNGYCIRSYSSKNPQPTPSEIGDCGRSVPTSCKPSSGFVIIAYAKKQKLDIGMNHANSFEQGKKATCQHLSGPSCSSHAKADQCRRAGCKWSVLSQQCTNS